MKLHLAIFNVVWCVLPSYVAYGVQDMFLLLPWNTSWVVADATSSPFVGFGDCTIPSFEPFKTMAHPCTTNWSLSQRRKKKHTHTHTHTCQNGVVTLQLYDSWLGKKGKKVSPLETKSNPFVICKADLKQVMKHYWTWNSCFALPSMVPSNSSVKFGGQDEPNPTSAPSSTSKPLMTHLWMNLVWDKPQTKLTIMDEPKLN